AVARAAVTSAVRQADSPGPSNRGAASRPAGSAWPTGPPGEPGRAPVPAPAPVLVPAPVIAACSAATAAPGSPRITPRADESGSCQRGPASTQRWAPVAE